MNANLYSQQISWLWLKSLIKLLESSSNLNEFKKTIQNSFLQYLKFELTEIYILENSDQADNFDQINQIAEIIFVSKTLIEEIFLNKKPYRLSKKEILIPVEYADRLLALIQLRSSNMLKDEDLDLLWAFGDGLGQIIHEMLFPHVNSLENKNRIKEISHSIFNNLKGFLEAALERLKLLEEQNQQLVKINETRTELINNVSHELRTPLVSIMGFSKILQRREITNDLVRESSDQIQSAGSRLSRMIDDLIQLNRASTKGWDINVERLDIGEICKFASEALAPLSKEHNFVFDFPETYPMVEADRKLLRQVIENLLINAIKYSPDGGDIVCCIKVDEMFVNFSIEDHGIGMTEEEQLKIFDRFYRVKNPKTENIPGLGLGLSICKDVLEALGASIDCFSQFSQGSRFTIRMRAVYGY